MPTTRPITIIVNPTSVGDLWGHELFRHTANCFSAASLVAFTEGTKFEDHNVTHATTYYYWVRARDMSYNVSSYIGPVTGVSSFIITSDIDSNAVTNIVQYQRTDADSPGIPMVTSLTSNATTLAFLSITTAGGPVLLTGKLHARFTLTNISLQDLTARITVDTVGGPALQSLNYRTQLRDSNPSVNKDADFNGVQNLPMVFAYLDPTSASAHTYYISGGPDHTQWNVDNIILQAVEMKR